MYGVTLGRKNWKQFYRFNALYYVILFRGRFYRVLGTENYNCACIVCAVNYSIFGLRKRYN